MRQKPVQGRPAKLAALAATLLLAACTTLRDAALPIAAALTPSVDAAEIVSGPPSGAMFEAEGQAVRGPWSEARIAQARADDRFDAFAAFAPVLGERFTEANHPLADAALERVLAPLGAAIGGARRCGRAAQWLHARWRPTF